MNLLTFKKVNQNEFAPFSALNKENRDALQEYIAKRQLSDKTIQNYEYIFIRIQKLLRAKINSGNILSNIDELLSLLDDKYLEAKDNDFARDIGLKPVISSMFLKLLLQMIKDKSDYIKVIDAIQLYEKRQSNYTSLHSKKQLNLTDVSYDKLIGALSSKEISDIDYVLMYLFINLGVRNTELTFVFLQQRPTLEIMDENYMYLDADLSDASDLHVVYVRNKYKLFKSYGTLETRIRDKKFVNIIKDMIHSGKKYLFMNRRGESYTTQTIGHYIKQQTKKIYGHGLTESIIYKIGMKHYKYIGDEKRQIDLAHSRPHNLATQTKYYE
jgi:hypothetical protein